MPLHILARAGVPETKLTVKLRWASGVELKQEFNSLRITGDTGLLAVSLDAGPSLPPDPPETQAAVLQILNGGEVLAQQNITVLKPGAPGTRQIELYWVVGKDDAGVAAAKTYIPTTDNPALAALEELLWGPASPGLEGFTSALPGPAEILKFPGRAADWGNRVTLRSLAVKDGAATADFSKELKAYGGGSNRIMLLNQQISRTLKQFPEIQEVKVTIDGQSEGRLQP